MKSSHPAESKAPTNYSPSVPMSVYRELAAELRTNKAVIDSLNSCNQQLIEQNQFLKQEIHNVVQATLNLGQAAGVARQAAQAANAQNFPSAIAPDTLAKLVRAETAAQANDQTSAQANTAQTQGIEEATFEPVQRKQPVQRVAATQPVAKATPRAPQSPIAVPATPHNRVPQPIAHKPVQSKVKQAPATKKRPAAQSPAPKKSPKQIQQPFKKQAAKPVHPSSFRPTETIPGKGTMAQVAPKPTGKLFTEQSGEYRSSALDSQEGKEIGGIWLALSIILIIVTAFGAGFLIMKPLLNDR
ncbi:MAG: hypothetical protein AAGC93_15585 [Cyanobacteria bacterium P01_F01_bin.53]